MKKFFAFCFLSVFLFNACKSSQESATKSKIPERETSGTTTQIEGVEDPENIKDSVPAAVADKTDNGIYANLPSTEFPAPVKDGTHVPYVNAATADHANDMIYTYSDTTFLHDYRKQLIAAGFQTSASPSTFLKIKGEDVFIVESEEGEGELVLRMHTTRDPKFRYQDIPHRAIPYPLDRKGMAAEYAKVQPPDESKTQTDYIFYNQTEDFVKDYEKRLIEAGFNNVRNEGEPPLYTKMIEKVEFMVTINQIDHKIHIQMQILKL